LDKYIVILFERYLNNQCSGEELETVLSLIQSGKFLKEWDYVLDKDARNLLENDTNIPLRREISKLDTHHRLLNSIEAHEKTRRIKPFKLIWKGLSIAAAASILVFFGWWFFSQNNNPNTIEHITYQNDIAPGKFGARLRLTNGEVIKLDGSKNGLSIGNKKISYADGTEIEPITGALTEKIYTAWTDNGNMYMINLPDGTTVWLNAGSQLDFPAKFTGEHRLVSLKGEAFFKVAKNKSLPFILESKGQRIEVLGTKFNINGYPDERTTTTTLVEGSVNITSSKSKFLLKPGQQALLDHAGVLAVSEADTTLATAWKNNKFVFENDDIQSVMRKISRWYDVEVVYDASIPNTTFGGKISRSQNVSAILRILERTGGVHFKVQGKKIYVSK